MVAWQLDETILTTYPMRITGYLGRIMIPCDWDLTVLSLSWVLGSCPEFNT